MKIFDPQYLSELKIVPDSLGDTAGVNILNAELHCSSSGRADMQKGAWKLVQQNLVDMQHITKILKGQAPLINRDADADFDIGNSLLQLTQQGNSLQLQLNFGPVIQSIFNELSHVHLDLPPVIVQPLHGNDENSYVINKDHMLQYMAKVSGGMVGHPELTLAGEEGFRPIMIPQKGDLQCSDSLELYLVLDTSGSMEDYMLTYKQQVKAILKTIANTVDLLDIVIVSFSTNDYQQRIHCENGDIDPVTKYLDSLTASGGTNLFGTVHKYLKLIKESDSSNKAIIVVTDGQHNEGNHTNKDVMKVVSGCDHDTTLSIYSIGVGDYDTRLKGALESAGATHMDISNVNGLQHEFSAYANVLALPKVVYTLLCEGQKLLDHAVAGAITVSNTIVPPGSTIQFGEQLYQLDIEEILPQENNILSDFDSKTNHNLDIAKFEDVSDAVAGAADPDPEQQPPGSSGGGDALAGSIGPSGSTTIQAEQPLELDLVQLDDVNSTVNDIPIAGESESNVEQSTPGILGSCVVM